MFGPDGGRLGFRKGPRISQYRLLCGTRFKDPAIIRDEANYRTTVHDKVINNSMSNTFKNTSNCMEILSYKGTIYRA